VARVAEQDDELIEIQPLSPPPGQGKRVVFHLDQPGFFSQGDDGRIIEKCLMRVIRPESGFLRRKNDDPAAGFQEWQIFCHQFIRLVPLQMFEDV